MAREAHPESGQAARGAWLSLNKLPDYLASRGLPEDAEQAGDHDQRSLEDSVHWGALHLEPPAEEGSRPHRERRSRRLRATSQLPPPPACGKLPGRWHPH